MTDTGVGMSAEVLAHVFEPFFTTKEVGKGSGLGLPQVYGFAEQSGGSVRIESALGRGATVILTLPRTERAPAAIEASNDVELDPTQGLRLDPFGRGRRRGGQPGDRHAGRAGL